MNYHTNVCFCIFQDINGDGYGDILVGHPLADPDTRNSAGAIYIILGGDAIESQLNVLRDLDGLNGFVLEGATAGDLSGTSVAEAGVSLLRRIASPLILPLHTHTHT